MKKHSSRFLDIVTDAKTRVNEIDLDALLARIEKDKKFLLIDVREDHEWAKGHIPNALHLGKGIIERDIEKITNDNQTEMVLYCGGGYRSALAADALQKMGYENVWSLDGGYSAWFKRFGSIDN